MNTDWNSPQGDFDTAEKQGELLMLLSRQKVTVHTWDDPDFDYMEEQDLALVVQSPSGTENLLIELCGEFSVFFEKWQGGRTEPVYGNRLAGHGAVHRAARCRGCRCGAQALLAGGKAGRCLVCGQSAGAGVLGPGTEPEGTVPGGIILSGTIWNIRRLCSGYFQRKNYFK